MAEEYVGAPNIGYASGPKTAPKSTMPDIRPKPTSHDERLGSITDGDLLQANATVIAGTLIFLTISSLGVIAEPTLTIVVALILLPFSASSVIIIVVTHQPALKNSRLSRLRIGLSGTGFGYLLTVIALLAYVQLYPPVYPIMTPAENCAINPGSYNITHVAKCSKFIPGSLAGDCALHPDRFHVKLKQCANFIE